MTVKIIHFSDILCVWAHIAQLRINELQVQFGEKIELEYHFLPLFSDTQTKIGDGWQEKGGYAGFAKHTQKVCSSFPLPNIHPDVWVKSRPTTSSQAHLFIKAIQLLSKDERLTGEMICAIRESFFHEGKDISDINILLDIAKKQGFETKDIIAMLSDGRAMAALFNDMALKDKYGIKGSPTLILNEGRQILYGNVGYKIIEANVLELLESPNPNNASWC